MDSRPSMKAGFGEFQEAGWERFEPRCTQQVVFRTLPKRSVQKAQVHARPAPFVYKKHLLRVVASQPVGGVDIDPVDCARSD